MGFGVFDEYNYSHLVEADMAATIELIYTIAYILISICLIAPPTEFVSAGLTVQNMFAPLLGSEDLNFIYHHIKRTSTTVVVHSFLPLGKDKYYAIIAKCEV